MHQGKQIRQQLQPGWLFTNIVVSYTYRSRKFCRATKVVATIRSIHETGRIVRLS